MTEVQEQAIDRHRRHAAVRSLLFFASLFLVVWLWIDPKLIYHAHGWMLQFDIYVPGMHTFEDTPYLPGAAVNRLAGLLSHYHACAWLGAAIITAVAWLLCFGTGRLIVAFGDARWLRWLQFAPALAVLAQYGRYSQYLPTNLGLVVALLLLYVYTRLPAKRKLLSFVACALFTAAIYLATTGAGVIFVALVVLFDLFVRRRYALCVANAAFAGVAPLTAGLLLTNLPMASAYLAAVPMPGGNDSTSVLVALTVVLVPLLAGLDWVLRRLFGRDRPDPPPRRSAVVMPYILTFVLLSALGATARLTINPAIRASMQLNYLARNGNWHQVLLQVRKIPDAYWTLFIGNDVNRALFHVNRLAYDMFSFRQHPDALLLNPATKFEGPGLAQGYYRRAELLYELGLINPAEHAAHEALELVNYNPTALRQLARINMVKGLPNAACIFLRVMCKDFVHRDWALRCMARIDADPELTADIEIKRMRALMAERDTIDSARSKNANEDLFLPLFQKNAGNRMAFEYIMAVNLLAGDLDSAMSNIALLDNFDYPELEIPRHYEEAILLFTGMTGKRLELTGRRISRRSIDRFEAFRSRVRQLGANPVGDPAKALEADFGDTYYYYLTFGAGRYTKTAEGLTK